MAVKHVRENRKCFNVKMCSDNIRALIYLALFADSHEKAINTFNQKNWPFNNFALKLSCGGGHGAGAAYGE